MSTTMSRQVFVTINHAGEALARLQSAMVVSVASGVEPLSADELAINLVGKDAVVSVLQDRFDAAVFDALPQLKVISNVAVGFDNIDVPAASSRGILVLNTPGVLDESVADFAFALLIAAARRVVEADRYVRNGKWTRWGFDLLLGTDLSKKTLGVVGMGRIGQALARRAAGFGMNIVYSQRSRVNQDFERQYNAEFVSLDELLKQSDFISLHCPLTDKTRHLIGPQQFALMKPNCFLINTARGAVVDEQALVSALASGQIKGAGLDVFENEPMVSAELLKMDNVVLAPHIASASVETRSAMASMAMNGVIDAFSGKLPANAVNAECWEKFCQKLGRGNCS